MNTTFRTVCDEETMALTYPGQTLYSCADCRQRVCLFEDLDATSDSGSDFVCPQCQTRRQIAARRTDHNTVSAFCQCRACIAARTPEGAERIESYDFWVSVAIPAGIAVKCSHLTEVAPISEGRRWWDR